MKGYWPQLQFECDCRISQNLGPSITFEHCTFTSSPKASHIRKGVFSPIVGPFIYDMVKSICQVQQ